jgi:hypothetical protein
METTAKPKAGVKLQCRPRLKQKEKFFSPEMRLDRVSQRRKSRR